MFTRPQSAAARRSFARRGVAIRRLRACAGDARTSNLRLDPRACPPFDSERQGCDFSLPALQIFQMPSPRLRPKLQSTPPPAPSTPRDLLAELLLQRRSPRHELEAETVIDHGEPARRERDALAIDAGDVLAFGGRAMREARLSGEFRGTPRQARAAATWRADRVRRSTRWPCRRARPSSTR